MRKLLIIGLLLYGGFIPIHSSTISSDAGSSYVRKGDYYFKHYEFKKAIVCYNRALNKNSSNVTAHLRKADAFSRLGQPGHAVQCYRSALNLGDSLSDQNILRYALLLFATRDYKESHYWLEEYQKRVDSDKRADKFLESIENPEPLYRDSVVQVVEVMREINSRNSDINPVVLGNQLLFASSRMNSVDAALRNGFYDIFAAQKMEDSTYKVHFYNNTINTSFHEGPLTLSGDGSQLFFTRNFQEDSKQMNVKLGIFSTPVPSDYNERIYPKKVQVEGFNHSIGHPAVNYDATRMYFISNPTTGFGALDLYVSEKQNGSWTYPENLGDKINSKGDEMFPYLFKDSLLFFASDGHGGLGGLDIFYIDLTRENSELVNVGYPINTRYDDFSLFLNPDGFSGYFCSNRPGGYGSDDIYKVELLKFRIKGSLYDMSNMAKVEEANIKLVLDNGEVIHIPKASDGTFEFSIEPGTDYKLIIEKEDYQAETIYLEGKDRPELEKELAIGLQRHLRTEVLLQAGVKYDFFSGNDSVSASYLDAVETLLSQNEANSNSDTLTLMARKMAFAEGDIYSFQLVKVGEQTQASTTQLIFNGESHTLNDDSLLVLLPVENEAGLKLQTDLEQIQNKDRIQDRILKLDSSPLLEEEANTLIADQKAALKDLERLMSLSINTGQVDGADTTIQQITAEGFSIIPRTGYTLKVRKIDSLGRSIAELEIPLTRNVKYDFNSGIVKDAQFGHQLEALFNQQKAMVPTDDQVLDINLVSKELKIHPGDEIAFSLLPDQSTISAFAPDDAVTSTILLRNRSFDVAANEKFVIQVPYSQEQKVSLETDMDYMAKHFSESTLNLDVDTLNFFTEITVDTSSYYARFRSMVVDTITSDEQEALAELEYLLSLSINTESVEDSAASEITTEGFSIVPQTEYALKVGKLSPTGEVMNEIELALSPGVKYDFSSDPEQKQSYGQELNSMLEKRKALVVAPEPRVNIELLSKELEIAAGDEIAFSLLPIGAVEGISSTIYLQDRAFDIATEEKFTIHIPYTSERKVNIQTDLAYLQANFEQEHIALNLDTVDFLSEITIDTSGFYKRYAKEETHTLSSDQADALAELEYLMGLSITTEQATDPAQKQITANGFSIVPQTSYSLIVGKAAQGGEVIEEMELQLSPGVKYDFGANPQARNDYRQMLNDMLGEREGVVLSKDSVVDISLLSKELELEEGEEIAFRLLPDPGVDGTNSTIYLSDREFNIAAQEDFTIRVPYIRDHRVNIQTDLAYLQANFEQENIALTVDTVDFFSEITIDTSEFYKRYAKEETHTLSSDQADALAELEYLMGLSITTEQATDLAQKQITANGFSIVPQTSYSLIVGKAAQGGEVIDEMELQLSPGVKYDFGANPQARADYRQMLNDMLGEREGVVLSKDSVVDISLLSKELELEEGEEIAFRLLPDPGVDGTNSTIYLSDREFNIAAQEDFTIRVPYIRDHRVNIQTDLAYLQANFEQENIALNVDTVDFFSEITIDTSEFYKRYAKEETHTLSSDQADALAELEYLMGLSITTEQASDLAQKQITANGFSIVPQTSYSLIVGKAAQDGEVIDEMELQLSPGVKYDFGANPQARADYRQMLNDMLGEREGVVLSKDSVVDISLLSKELELEEGEEIAFRLLPDPGVDGTNSTIYLSDREFNIAAQEDFTIRVPYIRDHRVNIQTDLAYLQENFAQENIALKLDTVDFFSEITIDTSGFYKRYAKEETHTLSSDQADALAELEYLMGLSITTEQATDPAQKQITADGFSIVPQTSYSLIVGKAAQGGEVIEEMELQLSPGVKYDFGANPEARADYRQMLNDMLGEREGVVLSADSVVDISLLSKELELEEGEEIAFRLLPDPGVDGTNSTIYLSDREFDIAAREDFTIRVPYIRDHRVNIQTDLAYLQANFAQENIALKLDTVDFFSEITIDTTGMYKRDREPGFKKIDQKLDIPQPIEPEPIVKSDIIFRLQIVASRKPLTDAQLENKYSGDREIEMFEEEGWYKYYIAETPTYFEAKQVLNKSDVKGGFIVAYEKGNKITLREAMTKQYKDRQKQSGFEVSDSIVSIVTVNFEFDKFSLRADEEQYLKNLVITKMKEFPETYAAVNGHTDIRGNSIYNMELSNGRAEFVKSIIVREGISSDRVQTFSFGESQVLKECGIPRGCDDSVHEVNRRVEIILFAPKE